jgi:hypothetical protein
MNNRVARVGTDSFAGSSVLSPTQEHGLVARTIGSISGRLRVVEDAVLLGT